MLIRAILSADHEGLFENANGSVESYAGTIYSLQMAASIEDVFADPSYVDDSGAAYWCSAAWESDEYDREQASKYAAALSIFSFIWMSYESLLLEKFNDRFRHDKPAVKARKIFAEETSSVDSTPSLAYLTKLARSCFDTSDELQTQISNIKIDQLNRPSSYGAEIVRLFRNHVIHGRDPIPIYNFDGTWAFRRFYSASKLILVLIQLLVKLKLTDLNVSIPLSNNEELEKAEAGTLFETMHLKGEMAQLPLFLPID